MGIFSQSAPRCNESSANQEQAFLKKSKRQRLKEKHARRMALQEQDEVLGRRSPPIPLSLPPEEWERRQKKSKGISSPLGKLDGFSPIPINRDAGRGIKYKAQSRRR